MESFFDFLARNNSKLSPELERLAYDVIGAAIEVHKEMGPGLPEKGYRQAMSRELSLRGIPHQPEAPVLIHYKGVVVAEGRIDILVANQLVVELKVVEHLTEVHRAQTLAYLKATKLRLGLLINFNVSLLRDGIKRVINSVNE
jgi:GxxExxY protein